LQQGRGCGKATSLTTLQRASICSQQSRALPSKCTRTLQKSLLREFSTTKDGVDQIASAVVRRENTRLLAALNQAADQEPMVRAAFGELLETFISEIGGSLERLGLQSNTARVDLLHALFVGLAIIELATARPNGQRRAKAVLKLAFQMLEEKRK
jgi:hypothetical protein